MLRIDRCKGDMSTEHRDTFKRTVLQYSSTRHFLKSSNNLIKILNAHITAKRVKPLLNVYLDSFLQFNSGYSISSKKVKIVLSYSDIYGQLHTYRTNLVRLFSASYKWDTHYVHISIFAGSLNIFQNCIVYAYVELIYLTCCKIANLVSTCLK